MSVGLMMLQLVAAALLWMRAAYRGFWRWRPLSESSCRGVGCYDHVMLYGLRDQPLCYRPVWYFPIDIIVLARRYRTAAALA